MEAIDSVHLNFSQGSAWGLNLLLAFIMFSVAIELSVGDFKKIAQYPKAAVVGIISQFLVLPLLTFLLILAWEPAPSIALGMIMVAACPGGNVSNFFSFMAKGNVALSVTLTAFSTVGAILFTPINLSFWASQYEPTARLLTKVDLSVLDVFTAVFIILGVPLIVGMTAKHKAPEWCLKYGNVFRKVSLGIFALFVVGALTANYEIFYNHIYLVVILVLIHNALALGGGYALARFSGLTSTDRRTIAIETGIQNSGLGLLLIFTFFDGLGGMALIAAWWGIWHMVSGMTVSYLWSRSN
ncbi:MULTISPECIES: bile acid:sodium symporter family protein [unclassified Imperialibacter]|uniref:bile acid:sodium symporter family protein n=1 Tax=unclassified Imperialibacter TaxID=2629706 RepID=UPI00125B5406|nr:MULTISPECIES: bile acid:sodium symporter family protein [unclassified Imperialibacter]CAD5246043.1 Symporter [Imperialibacter sp. 75]CAD5246071.1 Symporter [Imperialibacter sp. 89]VVS95946.1 Symporter [Imperialibacter sp. EC-SDR9]